MKEEQTEAPAQLALVPLSDDSIGGAIPPELIGNPEIAQVWCDEVEDTFKLIQRSGARLKRMHDYAMRPEYAGSGLWTRICASLGLTVEEASNRIRYATDDAYRASKQAHYLRSKELARLPKKTSASDGQTADDLAWLEAHRYDSAKANALYEAAVRTMRKQMERTLEKQVEQDDAPVEAPPRERAPRPVDQDQFIDDLVSRFRAMGYPYPHLTLAESLDQMQELARLAAIPDYLTLRSNVGKGRVAYRVADTYHRERFDVEVEGKHTPIQSWYEISPSGEDYLRESILQYFEEHDGRFPKTPDNIRSYAEYVHGAQCASNFRPSYVLYLYHRFGHPGATILDTSAGYGGRLVGFLSYYLYSHVPGAYIGIDPNEVAVAHNEEMARDLLMGQHVTLHPYPAEAEELYGLIPAGSCDFAFTSPPYFSKEHYAKDKTQSHIKFPQPEQWRKGFLRKMFDLQYAALKPGCFSVVNIAEKVEIRGFPAGSIRLREWAQAEAQDAGFIHDPSTDVEEYELTHGRGKNQPEGVKAEPVLIFKKPE